MDLSETPKESKTSVLEQLGLALQHKCAVGVFSSRQKAESALNELRTSGFSMDKVSILVRALQHDKMARVDTQDQVSEQANIDDEMDLITGAVLGGIDGLVVGMGTLLIPGVGFITGAGAIGLTLAAILAGAGIGRLSTAWFESTSKLGIASERASVYRSRVVHGEYLVIVHGTNEEIRLAESILGSGGIQEWGVYNPPNAILAS